MASNKESAKETAMIYAFEPSPSKSILIEFFSLIEVISSRIDFLDNIDSES